MTTEPTESPALAALDLGHTVALVDLRADSSEGVFTTRQGTRLSLANPREMVGADRVGFPRRDAPS